ncbi:sensor histidine kinase [Conexibacter arvalis]|uniref:Signal transduction histidine kinase n=1 Tax=Conexibacter arvalis TaxID=912552 RepID=A0A840IAS2_9ACTN|nr:ATP-binding protein [Conexibacter arvalis]MBB4661455.1 signal transduction histidine kinase [Conexibacter arvalis]
MSARLGDPAWRATAVTGLALLAALALALVAHDRGPRVAAVAVAAGTLPVVALVLVPRAVRHLRGDAGRSLLLALPVAALALALLVVAGLDGRRAVLLLAMAALGAAAGVVLIGSELRQRTANAGRRAARTPWQRLTAVERVRSLPWQAGAGALLIGWSALVGIGTAGPRLSGSGVAWTALLIALIGLGALVLVLVPLLVGAAARGDRDRLAQAREDERLRVAAHLHDSVLQTLALVQRQASDPAAVARLARGQERALRAWMAGEAELDAATLGGALHATVDEVERHEEVEIEATVLGDRALDEAGRALVAAAREALRNAARHAPGSAIVVFAELSRDGAAVWVRDEGGGFDPARIPSERRGVRDAIVGRMAGVGGEAAIDSSPGAGTEVALRLGDAIDRSASA